MKDFQHFMSFGRFVIQNMNTFELPTEIKFPHLQILLDHEFDHLRDTSGAMSWKIRAFILKLSEQGGISLEF